MKFALHTSPNLVKLDYGKLNIGCSWQKNHIHLLKTGILIFGLVVVFSILQNGCCGSGKVLSSADFWSSTNKNNQTKLSAMLIQMPIVLTPADCLYINGII